LGFTLLGLAGRGLAQGFTRAPPTRFAIRPYGPNHRRLGVSIGSHLAPPIQPGKPGQTDETALTGFSHQYDPVHSSAPRPGYGFTSYRVVHHCRQPDNLRTLASLYRSCPGFA